MTGVHFQTIKSRALCWMFQVHMVLNWRASQKTMSDTGLSSIPGKVCSIPIYRSKETTMRFFIHSCTSCCSITTPRRPAGSYQALITLWLPCFCGRGIILSTLLQANAGRWGKGVGASANFQCPYVDMCIYKYSLQYAILQYEVALKWGKQTFSWFLIQSQKSLLLQLNWRCLSFKRVSNYKSRWRTLSGVGDVCECFWMMLSKCFGRVQRLLLWDVSMLLPRNSHPQLYQNALATSVEASSSGNPNFSINNCLDVFAEVEVASTRSVFKNLLFLQFLGNNGIVFVNEGKQWRLQFKPIICTHSTPNAADTIRVISKLTLFSPCLWAWFHPLYNLFQWYSQSKEILLYLSI